MRNVSKDKPQNDFGPFWGVTILLITEKENYFCCKNVLISRFKLKSVRNSSRTSILATE